MIRWFIRWAWTISRFVVFASLLMLWVDYDKGPVEKEWIIIITIIIIIIIIVVIIMITFIIIINIISTISIIILIKISRVDYKDGSVVFPVILSFLCILGSLIHISLCLCFLSILVYSILLYKKQTLSIYIKKVWIENGS